MSHPSSAELEAFVIGALPSRRVLVLVQHLGACPECTKKLQAEARLEMALLDAAREHRARPRTVRTSARRRRGLLASAGVALALGGAMMFSVSHRPAKDPGMASGVVCPEVPSQLDCIAEAHQHGLYVRSPAWAGLPELDSHSGSRAGRDGTRFGGAL